MFPAILLSLVLTGFYVGVAHFLFGRTWRDMLWYAVAGYLGYGLAALGAVYLGWEWGRVGVTPVAVGSVGAWAALLAARLKL